MRDADQVAGDISVIPHGEPYSPASRSRNGTASKASGPRTPAPDQVPFASNSKATTGLIAVCQTTHGLRTRAWCLGCRRRDRGRPHAAPRLCRARSPTARRRSSRAWRRLGMRDREGWRPQHRVGRPGHPSFTFTGSILSGPSLFSVLSTSMNSVPRPYLKVTRLALTQRGMSSTSSCSTLTHSTGPIPPGKSNSSGSLNGGVTYHPRSASQMTGGFRHSSMVVQIENHGAKS